MTRKLQFLLTVLLLVVGVTSAWADNTVKYSTDGGSSWTEAADLNALSSVFSGATSDIQVQLLNDQTLTARLTWNKAYTLTIVPTKDITIKGPAGAMWFLANVDNAKIVMGNNTYKITLDGENKSHTNGDITRRENNGSVSLTNITFKDFNLNSTTHLCSSKEQGNADGLILENITIENCTNPETAYIYSNRVVNDVIKLKGYLNVDEKSTGTTIRTKLETKYDSGKSTYTTTGRIKVDDSAGALTATKTITVTFTEQSSTYVPQIGAAIIINSTNNFTDETAAVFALANNVAYGTFRQNKDLKLTQAYNLSVGEAGAATLVLPFESTIPTSPSGLTCYKLTYTSGDDITATAEESTLAANSPVLVIGTASTDYKFVSTATSGDAATGSGQTSAYGNMYGNYDASWPVPVQTDSKDNYILQNKASGLGFYKVVEGQNTLSPNRAYMSVKHNDGGSSPAPAFFSLDFNGMNGTTGISITSREETTRNNDGAVYNLNGVRMNGENLPKGIYVKNGRKFVVK